MKHILIFFLTACSVMAAGCNPTRRIDMKNETGGDASITFFIKEDSLLNSPFYLNSTPESTFRMQAQKPYNLIKLSFDIGPWTHTYLQDITDDLEKMEIKTDTGQVVLASPEEMHDYLWSRKTGITGRKIRILLKQ